jgi:hypothetical protein
MLSRSVVRAYIHGRTQVVSTGEKAKEIERKV